MLHLQSAFLLSLKVLGKQTPPLQVPQWGPYVQPVGPATGFKVGLFLVKLM